MNLYLDIETIPAQNPRILELLKAEAQDEISAVKAPANYKDEAKIAEYLTNKYAEINAGIEEKWRRTALDGAYGSICMIGYAIDDKEPQAVWYDYKQPEFERHILENFFADIGDACFHKVIGHNLIDFDLRFIWQRSVILGIKPPALPFNAKPWDGSVFDTMVAWAGLKNRVSLDKLSDVFGLERKGDIDGSKVWDAVQAGEMAKLEEYCKADVERTRGAYKRMNFVV